MLQSSQFKTPYNVRLKVFTESTECSYVISAKNVPDLMGIISHRHKDVEWWDYKDDSAFGAIKNEFGNVIIAIEVTQK